MFFKGDNGHMPNSDPVPGKVCHNNDHQPHRASGHNLAGEIQLVSNCAGSYGTLFAWSRIKLGRTRCLLLRRPHTRPSPQWLIRVKRHRSYVTVWPAHLRCRFCASDATHTPFLTERGAVGGSKHAPAKRKWMHAP